MVSSLANFCVDHRLVELLQHIYLCLIPIQIVPSRESLFQQNLLEQARYFSSSFHHVQGVHAPGEVLQPVSHTLKDGQYDSIQTPFKINKPVYGVGLIESLHIFENIIYQVTFSLFSPEHNI